MIKLLIAILLSLSLLVGVEQSIVPAYPTKPAHASGTWIWAYGKGFTWEWYNWGGLEPHVTLGMNVPATDWNCWNLWFYKDNGTWMSVETDPEHGHWRNYSPWGTTAWTKFYQLTKSWIVQNPIGRLTASRYIAQCDNHLSTPYEQSTPGPYNPTPVSTPVPLPTEWQ